MAVFLVDTSVIADLFDPKSDWFEWSAETLSRLEFENDLVINPIIYAECSIIHDSIEGLETAMSTLDFVMKEVPREALFLSGRAFMNYRRSGGNKSNVLPDFVIGAHAAVEGYGLITRDKGRFSKYFPSVSLVMPDGEF